MPQKRSASCRHCKPVWAVSGTDRAPEMPAGMKIPLTHSASSAGLAPRRLKLNKHMSLWKLLFQVILSYNIAVLLWLHKVFSEFVRLLDNYIHSKTAWQSSYAL